MRLKFSGLAESELAAIPLRDRKTLWVAIRLLKTEPYPDGVYGDITVDSVPVRFFSKESPPGHRLKVKKPPLSYRVLYVVDEEHEVVVIISVLTRSGAYPETDFYLAMFRAIIADYYNNEGWKYDLH
ncbi:MAG: hypothetical protein NUW14_01695 [Deltaproteobacteria bacterium]|uniref:hypothetical protein n=1 Tax=Candidatus Deferrimicrobium sp. TaxID=3060586 RepID=UPI00272AE39D|nr:hypothetical protein [Candidatus Deferrimicrobium sp.]MCR4308730.1 hypothetical protein [Deltaproteobacteria bacterium]